MMVASGPKTGRLARCSPHTLCVLKAGQGYQEPGPAHDSWVADLILAHGKRNYALYLFKKEVEEGLHYSRAAT